MYSFFQVFKLFSKRNKKRRKIYPLNSKNRKIEIDLNNSPVNTLNYKPKIKFNDVDHECYRLCLNKQINNLFNISFSSNIRICRKRRSYLSCNLYKVPKCEIPLNIDIGNNKTHIIVKEYISSSPENWDYVQYKTLSEVFFQTLTFNKTNIKTPEIYFWGYNYQKKSSYIGMFYIDADNFITISEVMSSPKINTLLDNYYQQIISEFQRLQFFHNDLINPGNILTHKKSPFKDSDFSYVIDFGEADISNERPFDKRSPTVILKRNSV